VTAAITIIRATARRLQGERRLPFFMIGLPILIMVLVGSIFGTGGQRLVVGVVAPEQANRELVQQHELLHLLRRRQRGQHLLVALTHGDRQVLDDSLRQRRIVGLRRCGLGRQSKLEVVRA
jgi:hypothetical protein